MGALRPDNGPAVAPGCQHKPLPCGWRAIVCRHQHPVFHGVPQVFQLLFPFPEGLPSLAFYGLSLPHRPPGDEFLHVFQQNHVWPHRSRPPQDDPGKAPDIPVNEGRTLGLGKVLAVRAEPCKSHLPPPDNLLRVNVPDRSLQMLRVGVVGPVQQNGVRVMVDGNGHRPPAGQLNPRGSSAAPGKVVHDDFFKKVRLLHDSSSNRGNLLLFLKLFCMQALIYQVKLWDFLNKFRIQYAVNTQ